MLVNGIFPFPVMFSNRPNTDFNFSLKCAVLYGLQILPVGTNLKNCPVVESEGIIFHSLIFYNLRS